MPPTSPIKEMLVPRIGRTLRYIDILMSKRLQEKQLSLKQFILLNHVKDKALPQSELALITHRDKGSLTRLIQSLERKEFIHREVAEYDKRVNLVRCTPAGCAALKNAYPIMIETFAALTEGLDQKDQKTIIEAMDLLKNRAIELIGPHQE